MGSNFFVPPRIKFDLQHMGCILSSFLNSNILHEFASVCKRAKLCTYLTSQNIEFLLILLQKLMGSRTLLSRLMGSVEPIEPMLTTALYF